MGSFIKLSNFAKVFCADSLKGVIGKIRDSFLCGAAILKDYC